MLNETYVPLCDASAHVAIDDSGLILLDTVATNATKAKLKAIGLSKTATDWISLEKKGYKVEEIFICQQLNK